MIVLQYKKPRRARIALRPLRPKVSIRDHLGPQNAVCYYCKARHWECERNKNTHHFSTCASQGKVQQPPPPQPTPEYRHLLEGSDAEAVSFREHARSYNNALSFTSLSPHFDQTRMQTPRPPVFRVFGRLYHRLGALIPAVTRRPAFAQPLDLTAQRGPMQRSVLSKLEAMLRTGNRFVRGVASAKARAGWDTAKEGSCAYAYQQYGPQNLILQVHGDLCPDGRPKYKVVSSLHPFAMPLLYPLYPLLFPTGEDGFHPKIPLRGFEEAGPPIARNREQFDIGIELGDILAALGCDDDDDEENDDDDDDGGNVDIEGGSTRVSCSQFFAYYVHERDDCCSIPHHLERLFLEFVIDGYPQVETDRLNYIRSHQDRLRVTATQGITDAVVHGLTTDQNGRSVILGSTFRNGPREITQRYEDAMACVIECGKPSLFITMTCNPNWVEIKSVLGPVESAHNRPDLIARVSEAKLHRLCDDAFGNKNRAGCLGAVLTHTHVIEYQKRGVPHAHILFTLALDDHPMTTEAIDKIISAKKPNPTRYPDLYETVTQHMFHGKCGGNSNQPA
ncbi:BQ2448_6984 [Microbotryum intermedium]|uniref:BQ2448_6984 protein n=1 Tax=Microbotryum intermedium TaxID=269621 RepID=A0A238FJT7_9BASI|nr:BQ2448_6984 [Microbotryum intermedium]